MCVYSKIKMWKNGDFVWWFPSFWSCLLDLLRTEFLHLRIGRGKVDWRLNKRVTVWVRYRERERFSFLIWDVFLGGAILMCELLEVGESRTLKVSTMILWVQCRAVYFRLSDPKFWIRKIMIRIRFEKFQIFENRIFEILGCDTDIWNL